MNRDKGREEDTKKEEEVQLGGKGEKKRLLDIRALKNKDKR